MAVEELEFLVYYDRPVCVALPADDATLSQLKASVQERAGVPVDRLELLFNGLKLGDDDVVPTAPAIVRARMTDGLLGGKGGFGAMLRSSGKGASGKATTSFGACRDLNGRRLRHVNQEIAMEKWRQESSERDKRKKLGITDQELMEEETPSGIPGWYLATPSWAEGVKKSYMKRRRNTAMCRHWVQVREDGRTPPANAPRWWGCPRGRDCDFAHGEEELRGEALTEYKRQKKDAEYQKKQNALNRYVNYEQDVTIDIHDAVRQGMRNRSNGKVKLQAVPAPVMEELPEPPVDMEIPEQWLSSVNDSVVTTFKHSICELRGAGNFGTATVHDCHLDNGKWYYEVRLVTDGIIQVGWADTAFTANSDSGDGVGDHERSWAYDGCRQLKWNGGKESDYGQEWESGDIIGCLLDADAGTIQFSRNGELMGMAFTSILPATKDNSGYYPAISIEKTEIVLVNIGAQPFLYLPSGYKPVAQSLRSKSPQTAPESKPEKVVDAGHETSTKELKEDLPVEMLDLEAFDSAEALETLGLDALKQQLQVRKLKCGGTLSDRAKRLFSVKGKLWDEIDPRIKDFKALRK